MQPPAEQSAFEMVFSCFLGRHEIRCRIQGGTGLKNIQTDVNMKLAVVFQLPMV